MYEKNDLISIVIPVYNVEQYLSKCIDSILNQTYKNLEIILVNDGSPDRCPEICEEYRLKDNRIKVINKENGGLSDARNVGIDNSSGNYVTFIDSDDYIDDDYIDILYKTLILYNADLSIASHKVIYPKKIIDKATGEKFCTNSKEVLERILYDEGIDLSAWGKLYKKSLFNNIKFPKGRLFEDSATTYRLIDASKKIAVNSKSVYNYVIRNNSISNEMFSEKKMDLIISTKEMTDLIKKRYPELEKGCERRLMYAYLSTLTQLAKAKEKNKSIQVKLMNYIKHNRRRVLKDKRIPKRDRNGIISTMFGFEFYKHMWNIYAIFSGRS